MVTRGWWIKLVLLVAVVAWAVLTVGPTVFNLNPETTKWPVKQKVNLGLDLQGGLYMVLGVDFDRVFRDVVERQSFALTDALKEKGLAVNKVSFVKDGVPQDDPRIVVDLDAANRDKTLEYIKKDFWMLRLAGDKPGQLELGLSTEYRIEVREKTINQSIEVIRNRIDEFGVSEPSITSQGNSRVVVELPGVKDVQRAKDLIGRTAKLEFKMVDDKSISAGQLAAFVADAEKAGGFSYKEGERFSDYVAKINAALKSKIPAGHEVAFERVKETPNATPIYVPYLMFSKTEVTGDELADAQVGMDQEQGRPIVSFTLNPRGADLFDKLTAANIGNRLAIVLDNIVHSAPVIQSRIGGGRGQITLGQGSGDKVLQEAKDLAIVLRAGALPAQLEFLEQRVVGPSLGQDSIALGARAALVGCVLLFLFVAFYYRGSGLVAVFSLVLNGLFTLAILIGLDATLTLPGMAGIALTIGMAVDSNVLIFERIRDELREGKAIAAAIEAGFQKAFTAIFDANITHGIIAVILMSFGTGPIRGFAVTLLIGIVSTLFCAVTVCKLVFDGFIGFNGGELKRLSI